MIRDLYSTFVLVAHWLIIIGLTIRVVMRRPPIGVALAWLAVIASVPFVGAAAYLLVGEKRLGRRRTARIASMLAEIDAWQARVRAASVPSDELSPTGRSLAHHAERLLGLPPLAGNTLELLEDYGTAFDAIVADIDAARRTCHLGFYIWHEGGRVSDVADALERAARRGVRCRALADAVGSKAFLGGRLAERLRAAGVEVRAALPSGPVPAMFGRRDLRNHRKIVAIDDRVAYTGSQNLVDPRYFKQEAGVGPWVDALVRVTGPAASVLDGVFRFDWAVETGRPFDAPPFDGTGRADGSVVQVVPSGPGRRPEAIHQLLLTAMFAARRELIISSPYFVPDDALLAALVSAALRGVEVTLIVPARNDSLLVRYASPAHFDDLLSAGARIALFRGGLVHTKSLTVDGELSVFGSVNFDMRSLWLNFEISLVVDDPAFTGRLRDLQRRYVEASEPLELEAWRRRPAGRRLAENTARLLGPLL